MACKIIYKGVSYDESDFKSQIERYVAINNLFNENETLANAVYETLGFKNTNIPTEIKNLLNKFEGLYLTGSSILNVKRKADDFDFIYKGDDVKILDWLKEQNIKPIKSNIDISFEYKGYKISIALNQETKKFLNKIGVKLEDYLEDDKMLFNLTIKYKEVFNRQKDIEDLKEIKQQAQQLYSQYLEQNPNGSVEQFKNWVDEFNRNNQKLNSNIQIFSKNKEGNFDSSSLKDDDLALMLFNQALGLNLTSTNQLTWDNIKDNIFFEKEDGSLGVKNLAFVGGNLLSTKKPTLRDFLNQKGLFPEYKVFIGESVIYPNVFETLQTENEIIKKSVFENLFNLSGAFEQVKKELNNQSPETFIIETPQGKFTFPKRFAAGFFKIASTVEFLLKENQSSYIQDYLSNKRKKEDIIKDGKKIKPVITQTLTVNDTIVQNAIGLIGNSIIENAIKNNDSVKIQVFSNAEFSEDGIAGWYLPASNTIYLHESMLRPQHLSEGLPLIAHELIHSVTEQSLQFDKNFQREIQSLLDRVKAQSKIKDFYGFKNTSEFLSEAFSSQEFRQLLKDTQFSSTENLSVWQKFVNAILELFGKNVKYTEKSTLVTAEEILNDIINDNKHKIQYVKSTILDKFNTDKSLSDFISQKSQERLNQIQQIFNENSELSKIGTVEQYASYLNTIFPDSKVSEIDNSLYISVLEDLKSNKIIKKQCS